MTAVFEVTEAARAEIEKRRKRARDAEEAATPAHAAAEGHMEHLEREREKRDAALKGRHPETGQFTADPKHPYLVEGHAADSPGNGSATPRPATSWPGSDAHAAKALNTSFTQVGDRQAGMPSTRTTLTDQHGADHPERLMHAGTAEVQHFDMTTGTPVRPSTTPRQAPLHTAPTTAGSN